MIWGCLYFPRRKLIHPPVAPPGAACDEESPSQEAAWACQPRARSPQACVSTLAPIPLGVGARTRPKRRALQRSCSYTPWLLRQVPRATRSCRSSRRRGRGRAALLRRGFGLALKNPRRPPAAATVAAAAAAAAV